ncbi:MAG: hypothetical protein QOI24_1304 [Acidobacteriota bacterium]|jgi:tetratricopeptide (TPR) repeat protein|nr:hypothetical protein [Acidobacteriota bacterium]
MQARRDGAALIVLLVVMCKGIDTPLPVKEVTLGKLQDTTMRLLAAGRCNDAIDLISQQRQLNSNPLWYILLADAYGECFNRSREKGTLDNAHAILRQGTLRFPRSSRLLLAHGALYDRFGDEGVGAPQLAKRFFDNARLVALANIASDQSGERSYEDRDVLKNLEQLAQPQERRSDAGSDSDVTDNDWHDRAVMLLQSGDCTKVVAFLESRSEAARRSVDWFVILADANALCFREGGEPSYRQAALRSVEKGLALFPRSAVLMLAKGRVSEVMRDYETARGAYRDAERLARENLRAGDDVDATGRDREVLRILSKHVTPR